MASSGAKTSAGWACSTGSGRPLMTSARLPTARRMVAAPPPIRAAERTAVQARAGATSRVRARPCTSAAGSVIPSRLSRRVHTAVRATTGGMAKRMAQVMRRSTAGPRSGARGRGPDDRHRRGLEQVVDEGLGTTARPADRQDVVGLVHEKQARLAGTQGAPGEAERGEPALAVELGVVAADLLDRTMGERRLLRTRLPSSKGCRFGRSARV